jgi:hypothetical protein
MHLDHLLAELFYIGAGRFLLGQLAQLDLSLIVFERVADKRLICVGPGRRLICGQAWSAWSAWCAWLAGDGLLYCLRGLLLHAHAGPLLLGMRGGTD